MNEHSQKVYNVMLYLGYPESFALLIAREMSTEYTAGRIIAYFGRAGKPPLEEVADEMLAILSDRDRIRDKHQLEYAQSKINELYRDINSEE
jgi:hypothetical protein